MLNTDFLEKLSKDYILSKLSQIEIFAEFLGISIIEIDNCLHNSRLICSPLRTDTKPTCGFYYDNSNKLRFNDFAGYFHGDCFDVVAYQHNIDSNNPQGFAICLDLIARRFKLHKYNGDNLNVINTNNAFIILDNIRITKTTIIEVQSRTWNTSDIKYWKSGNVTTALLEAHDVIPVYSAWINSKQVYYFNYNDPAYAYYFGVKDGIHQWKLYFPMRTNYKFITNSRRLGGLNFAKESDAGIITKSMKDVLVHKSFGIESAAVAGETIEPSKAEISYLLAKWKTTYSLMDWDYAGIRMSQILKRKYGIIPLFYTNSTKSAVNYQAKDSFEFVNFWGTSVFQEMTEYHQLEGFALTSDYYDFITHLLN